MFMTDKEKTKRAVYMWMRLLKEKTSLNIADLEKMEELLTAVITTSFEVKEKQMIDKVCEWLETNGGLYIDYEERGAKVNVTKMIRDLKQTFKE